MSLNKIRMWSKLLIVFPGGQWRQQRRFNEATTGPNPPDHGANSATITTIG